MEGDTQTTKLSCKDKVMSRIECEKICPRSKTFFRTRECFVWALWAVSVVIGAFAIAVTLFVLAHRQYALFEATHENFLTFIIEFLPYLWMGVFALMVGVAVYNLRHTKGGYRYPLWQIFGSSMVLSLAGGSALHVFGFGYFIDHELGEQMSMYNSQEKMEMRMWQSPEDGRLIGRLVEAPRAPIAIATFADMSGRTWQIDMSELATYEQELLLKEDTVRLMGVLDTEANLFHSCGAFPWLLDKPTKRQDFEAVREAFEMKINSYEERLEKKLQKSTTSETGETKSRCEEMAPIRRMRGESR